MYLMRLMHEHVEETIVSVHSHESYVLTEMVNLQSSYHDTTTCNENRVLIPRTKMVS